MLMRKLGRTGMKVAALCLGGNTFGWTTDQKASEAVLDAYMEAGGNFIDTADVYSRWAPGNKGGESETALGIWMAARKNRQAVIMATKVCGPMGQGPNDAGLSRLHIMKAVEASLTRLKTDYIDLYQAHWDDKDTPLEETLRAFDDLVRQGKVRYIGCSNLPAWQIADAVWTSRCHELSAFVSGQDEYSLLARDAERELLPALSTLGLGLLPYYPLAGGLLTGKYKRGKPLPEGARLTYTKASAERFLIDRNWTKVEQLESFCSERGHSLIELAFAWLAARQPVASIIAGATRPEQIDANVKAVAWQLTATEIAEVDRISA
jgi:aryl-alcohol dehydrogenase-like predicted oxidoreductase